MSKNRKEAASMQRKNRRRFCFPGLLLLVCMGILQLLPAAVWAVTTPVTARIPVTCTGENTDEAFTCVLEMGTTELQTPDRLVLHLKDGESGDFSIQYVYPGTYHYRIRQEAGSDSRTSYDTREYTVDVYVTEDEKGTLYAEPVVYLEGQDEKNCSVSFHNSKELPKTPSRVSHPGPVSTGDNRSLSGYLLLTAGAGLLFLLLAAAFRKRKGR